MFGDLFGTCECDHADCEVARAVRKAAAERLLASMKAEYGDTWHFDDDFPLWHFPSREWVCRAFPSRSSRACPGCGYVPSKVPSNITFGVVFGLKGALYRVVSVSSTNRYSPNGFHFEDYATCELEHRARPSPGDHLEARRTAGDDEPVADGESVRADGSQSVDRSNRRAAAASPTPRDRCRRPFISFGWRLTK